MLKDKKAKERILEGAIDLFAEKGFAAVGIREIAGRAKINVSMISYYFNGKNGILKEIIHIFFDSFQDVLKESIPGTGSFDENIYRVVKNLVSYVRRNRNLFKVAFYELPFEIPEIAEIRAEKITEITTILRDNLLSHINADDGLKKFFPVAGPAVMTMVFSNFILGPVIEIAFKRVFDDEFYEFYSKTITEMILHGFYGLIDTSERYP